MCSGMPNSLYNWSLTNHLIVSLTKNLVLLSIAKKTSYSSTAKTLKKVDCKKLLFSNLQSVDVVKCRLSLSIRRTNKDDTQRHRQPFTGQPSRRSRQATHFMCVMLGSRMGRPLDKLTNIVARLRGW